MPSQEIYDNKSGQNFSVGYAEAGPGCAAPRVVTTAGGVLAAEWFAYLQPNQTVTVAAPPSGFRLVLTELDGSGVSPRIYLDEVNGFLFARSVEFKWRGRIELERPLVLTSTSGEVTSVRARYHYEKIQLTDGLVAVWNFTGTNPLVDRIFGRVLSADLGSESYTLTSEGLFIPGDLNGDRGSLGVQLHNFDPLLARSTDPWTILCVAHLPFEADYNFVTLGVDGSQFACRFIASPNAWSAGAGAGGDTQNAPAGSGCFALVADGATCRAYVDGFNNSGGNGYSYTPNKNDTSFFRLFGLTAGGQTSAQYRAVYAWNRALSAAEVAALGTGAEPNLPKL